MILDSSAVLSLFFNEPLKDVLLDRMEGADFLGIGAPTLAETGIVLTARTRVEELLLYEFIRQMDITVIPFTLDHYREAIRAYRIFGKGRHPAALNFGDCLTYAVAKVSGLPLLCVGDDFRKTDLPVVVVP